MLDGSNFRYSHLHFTGFYGILRYAKLPTSYHELFAKVPRIKCNSHLNSTSFQRNPPVHEYYTSIDLSKHITLDSPEMVLKSMYPIMKGLEHKEYWVIFTNRRHTHIKTIRHTIGSHDSLLDVRIILRQAIELNATGIILVSNSVDGSVEPTLHDIEYTKKLHKAAGLLDIYLIDHVIISASSYHSITDHQTHPITTEFLTTLQEK